MLPITHHIVFPFIVSSAVGSLTINAFQTNPTIIQMSKTNNNAEWSRTAYANRVADTRWNFAVKNNHIHRSHSPEHGRYFIGFDFGISHLHHSRNRTAVHRSTTKRKQNETAKQSRTCNSTLSCFVRFNSWIHFSCFALFDDNITTQHATFILLYSIDVNSQMLGFAVKSIIMDTLLEIHLFIIFFDMFLNSDPDFFIYCIQVFWQPNMNKITWPCVPNMMEWADVFSLIDSHTFNCASGNHWIKQVEKPTSFNMNDNVVCICEIYHSTGAW